MATPYPIPRKLVLGDEMENINVKTLIEQIININNTDDEFCYEYNNFKRKPIILYINSEGGSPYNAMSLYDVITNSETYVYTVALGSCMSSALWVYLAGKKRFVCAHSTLMFHDATIGMMSKKEFLKEEIAEVDRIMNQYITDMIESSEIPKSLIEETIQKKKDLFIPAELAIKYKLADGYLDLSKLK